MSEILHIALIEDDEDDYFLFQDLLQSSQNDQAYQLKWFNNYEQGIKGIKEQQWDLIFIDHLLGLKTGLDLLQELRSLNRKTPAIILTGVGNNSLDLQALRLGADDYIPKAELTHSNLWRSIRHVRERRSQKLALEQESQKFKALFESSLSGNFLCNEEMKIIEANSAFSAILNSNVFPIELKTLFKDDSQFEQLLGRLNKVGSHTFEVDLKIFNHETPEIKALLFFQKLHAQPTSAYQGAILDISELHRTREKLNTIEKINLTGRMIRNIGHDIRNPLSSIQLATEQIVDECNDKPDVQELGAIIQRNVGRINTLLTNLLNNTRLPENHWVEMAIEDILLEVLEFNADRIKMRHIDLRTSGMDQKTILKLLPTKLKVAFSNIISNAIEALEGIQNPKLQLNLNQVNKFVEINITDNGVGMDAHTQNHLFEAFFTSRPGGLGLGLSATLQYIEEHQGLIQVDSQQGKGTRFTIQLPFN